MAKLKKDKVIKEINEEGLIADYLSAGWQIVDEVKPKAIEENNKEKIL